MGGQQFFDVSYTDKEAFEALKIINQGKVWLNNTAFPVVDLQVIPGDHSDPELLEFKWNCTKVTNRYIDI